MLTLASFLEGYPEFQNAGSTLVESKLGEAALSINATVWGSKADQGHGLLTAHLLALSPYGQNARLSGPDGSSTWGDHFERLRWQVGCGLRVG